ncbi:MAG: CAP domain-containing protein [Hyphomicrobiaceae bacterium]|nr:CAP domain-containing protein [Hyphomicrobiaceae bacterium]
MPTILPDIPQAETLIIEMTNTYRARQQLGSVQTSPALRAAAKAYADYLARTDRFAHDADGRSHADRAKAAGYEYCEVSENLARSLDSRGFETRALARTTVEGWLNSPGHRRNIEAPNVTETGVAVVRVPDKHPKYIAVQLFGRPRALAFDVQIANTTKTELAYSFGAERHRLSPSMAATHTACHPVNLTFLGATAGNASATPATTARKGAAPGKSPLARADSASFEASSEQVFVIAPGRNGKPVVSVETRRRVE